ncbi:PAS domain S-box protein [Planococcus sp. 4-30]|uniref:PAS domain S-box protein n=1 Tax=Planococcus sp. 4-30 TaxID=2874583 RepID=UPI001CBE6642|nr:PAS domain S-box protein [Planococcus sp. 4-30]
MMKDITKKGGEDILTSTPLFDLIKDPIFLMEEAHDSYRYIYVNPSALSIMPSQNIIGCLIEEIFPKELSDRLIQHYKKAKAAQKPIEFIEKIETGFGEFIGETMLNPIEAENGQSQYILAVVRDVTEREYKNKDLQKTKRAIEIERKRLNSLVENNGNAVFEFDQQKNFISINKMVTEVTGFTEEELLGQSIVSLIIETDLKDTIAHFEEALKGRSVEFETTIYTKNKQMATFQVNTVPIIDEDIVLGIYAIAKEITVQKNTERLLRENEQRYKSLFDNHPHGIFTFDRTGNLNSINAGTETITGYSLKELQANAFIAVVMPEETDKVRHHFFESIHTKRPERYEMGFHKKDGDLIDLQVLNIPIIVDGELLGIHGIVTDITEKKRAQKALLEAKEELEVFWKSSTDPIFYIDTKGDILKVNPAFEETFEFTEEEMIRGEGTIIPPHMTSDQDNIVERILAGETVKFHDTLRINKSGKPLNIISSYSPVHDADKKVVGATIVYKNVTELKKAEQELQKSQEKYKLITESTFDIITLIDLSGQIEYVSPASEKILGYPDQTYIGSPFTTHIHPEDAFDLIESVASLIDGGEPTTIEVRYLHREGHYIWMEVSPTPVLSNGELKQFFTISRDITERRRLQDKVAKMAFYDHLSGIPNRRTFDDKLKKAIHQAKRTGKKVGVLMLDGRKFKQINDQFGHDAGDAVIKEMAVRLQASIRSSDTVARLGGDEMGIILPEIDSVEMAENTAIRILKSFEVPLNFNGFNIRIGAGIGISLYPDDAVNEKQLVKYADMALYEAKTSDQDQYKIYS